MLVLRKYGSDPSVVTPGGPFAKARLAVHDKLDRLPLQFYDWTQSNWWTVGWLPYHIGPAIQAHRPDIVHFHWTGRGVAPIALLPRLRRYVLVWTLRDMWPLTGGCHYSGGCTRFLTGCGSCPQLRSVGQIDISRWQWRRKLRHWHNLEINFIALSNWLAGYARSSPLVGDNEVSVIPNGVDVQRFAPADKASARSLWRLPQDRRIVLFGALMSDIDPRKGFVYLRDALRQLAAKGWGERAMCVVFGADYSHLDVGLPIYSVGRIDEDVNLARLYACADAMVAPSIEENMGKTALEAMASGTPVVAFANTGQFDIIDHRIDGYLAENLSAADLARGIEWCLEEGARGTALSRQARSKVLRCFDIRDIAHRHVALYERVLQRRLAAGATAPGTTRRTVGALPGGPAGS